MITEFQDQLTQLNLLIYSQNSYSTWKQILLHTIFNNIHSEDICDAPAQFFLLLQNTAYAQRTERY